MTESERTIIDEKWGLIKDYVYVTKTNEKHIYVNFNIIGQKLSTEIIIGHLKEILAEYSAIGQKLYIQPRLGFLLFSHESGKAEKYFYPSSNTAIFPYYRLLSQKTMKRMKEYVDGLYEKDFPFYMKQNAAERSSLGFTLITNINYSLVIV